LVRRIKKAGRMMGRKVVWVRVRRWEEVWLKKNKKWVFHRLI